MTFLKNMDNPWIFDSEKLEFTPSQRDGITKLQERWLRIDGSKFIQNLGAQQLNLHHCTVATGAVFFHRFYMFYSFKMFPVYPMAATCLFLAGKVEETPKKSSDIVRFSKHILKEHEFSQFGSEPKEEILTLEKILLQTLRFDLEVGHPYEHLINYVKEFSVIMKDGQRDETAHKEIIQSSWTFMNDSYYTTICLQYEPEIVAMAMILMSCKTGVFEIRDWENRKEGHKFWWDAYVENMSELALESICHQILDVYLLMKTNRVDGDVNTSVIVNQ